MEINITRDELPEPIKNEYENILSKFKDQTKLPYLNNLIKFAEEYTYFLTAPASTKYHLSCKHGLLLHSLSVTSLMFDMKESRSYFSDISDESIVVTGLFHDLGKAGEDLQNPYYIECEATPKQKAAGYGPSQPYKMNDMTVKFEHAHLSALLVAKYYPVATYEELQAILIHDGTEKLSNQDYIMKECKLQTLLHHADVESAKWVEIK